MKKLLSIVSTIAILLSLTACSTSKTEINGVTIHKQAVPISEVTGEFDKHFEICKSKEYINLDWTNTQKTQVPTFGECHNVEVSDVFERPSNKDAFAQFESLCQWYFGEDYDNSNVYFSADEFPSMPIEGGGITYERGGTRLNDYRDKVENDDSILIYDYIYLDLEKKIYLWGTPVRQAIWVTRGAAITLSGRRYRPTGLLPADLLTEYPYETFFNDGTLSEKTYRLSDGDYSIGEAIDYFVNDYYLSQPFDNEGVSCAVRTVSAIKVKDDLFFYLLKFAPSWNSIPFDTRGEFVSSSYVPYQYYNFNCQAIIVKKNDVDMAYNYVPPTINEVGEPIDRMLTLDKAADIASESLSSAVKFEVRSAELIYTGPEDKETHIGSLHPAWKFTLFNTNDEMYYDVYVNAVSGECTYFSYSM